MLSCDLLVDSNYRQQSQGLLPTGTAFDLFRGTAQGQRDEIESFPTTLDREIRVPKACHHECGKFSPDGHMLITGSADGMIEVWDFMTGKIRQDLEYQADEQYMCHSTAVLCVDLTKDNELLVSGWKLTFIRYLELAAKLSNFWYKFLSAFE